MVCFSSSFFSTTFFDICGGVGGADVVTGGGGRQAYVRARPVLRRRLIPRFTRVIRVRITHIYWLTSRMWWELPTVYLKNLLITVPTNYLYKSQIPFKISHSYLIKSMINTRIPTKPHPEILKRLTAFLKEVSKWE